jgi:arylmalonate decarboxylase
MSLSRRNALKLSATLATSLLLGAIPVHAANRKKLGLIFPPKDRGVPEEGLALYGSEVEFLVEGLGLKSMTPEGYEGVIDLIAPTAEILSKRGAEAIVLMGTSLTFYKGEEFNQRLTNQVREASGLPAITMSSAIIEGLKQVGAKRVVAATAYNDVVNSRLVSFLQEHGFEIAAIKGLGLEKIDAPELLTIPKLLEFSTGVYESSTEADSILVSCGGLRTLELLLPLETVCKVPAVSSTPHAIMAGAGLLGLDGMAPGYGSLLSKGKEVDV